MNLKNTIIALLFILVLQNVNNAQNSFYFDDIVLNNQAYSKDGSLIFSGVQNSIPVIVKVSNANIVEWVVNPCGLNVINDVNVIENSIFVSGFKIVGVNYENFLIKLDANGNLIWSQMLLTNQNLQTKLDNQNANILNFNYLSLTGIQNTEYTIHVFDTSGTELWNKSIPSSNSNYTSTFDTLGNLYLNFCNSGELNLVKLSNTGNLIFHNKYLFDSGSIWDISTTSMITTSSNKIICVGLNYLTDMPYVLEFDLSGNFINGKYFQSLRLAFLDLIEIDGYEYISGSIETPDCSFGPPPPCYHHSFIFKIDSIFTIVDKLFFPDQSWSDPLANCKTEVLMSSGSEYVRFDTSGFNYCDSVSFSINTYNILAPTITTVNLFGSTSSFVNQTGTNTFFNSNINPGCLTAINESDEDLLLEIYPNPNNGDFTLNYNLGKSSNGKFKIYNAIGKLVYEKKLTQNNGSLNEVIELSSGVYVWYVEVDGVFIKNDKFIVVK